VVPINAAGWGAAVFANVLQNAVPTTVVSVLGPAYIRRKPPTPATTEYCTGDYFAVIRYTDAAKVPTILRDNAQDFDVSLTPMWSWKQPTSIATLNWTLWTMSLTANPNKGDGLVTNQFRPNKTTFPGAPIGSLPFTVKSRTKTIISIMLRYPGNDPGRLQITVKDANQKDLDPYEEANGNLTFDAQTARGIISDQVRSTLRDYWGQALIDFNVDSDMTPPSKMNIAGFNAGKFNVGNQNNPGNAFLALETNPKLHSPNAINLWLMKALSSGDLGIALQGGTTAIVTEYLNSPIPAHEIGHCIGLDDAEDLPAVEGILNNTTPTEGDANARKRLLMLHVGTQHRVQGGWLSTPENVRARLIVSTLSPRYVALFQIEPN
jgi:hypothetical protein